MFDVKRFLEENFGTPDGVVGLASKHSVDIPARDAIRKWFERGKIPGEGVLALQLIAQRETGRLVNVEHYLASEARDDIFA